MLSEGEEAYIDSLKKVIESDPVDTILVNAYMEWDNIIYTVDPALDLELNQKILEVCNKNLEKGGHNKTLDRLRMTKKYHRFLVQAY